MERIDGTNCFSFKKFSEEEMKIRRQEMENYIRYVGKSNWQYFYFDGIELYSDNCWYYKDTWHDYNEEKEDIGTIPYNVDLIGLIKCLEELEVIYKESGLARE